MEATCICVPCRKASEVLPWAVIILLCCQALLAVLAPLPAQHSPRMQPRLGSGPAAYMENTTWEAVSRCQRKLSSVAVSFWNAQLHIWSVLLWGCVIIPQGATLGFHAEMFVLHKNPVAKQFLLKQPATTPCIVCLRVCVCVGTQKGI